MRARISEKNILPEFDIETEYRKIQALCQDTTAFGTNTAGGFSKTRPNSSYSSLLQCFFLKWPLRGSFTSVEEMLSALKISENDFVEEATEERLLDYIQFTLNVVLFLDRLVKSDKYSVYKATDSVGEAIRNNCCLIAEKLGTDIKKEKNEIYLVYKDDIATAVCNENPEIESSITEYQKIDSRGDWTRKAEVLCTLYKRLEADERKLKGSEGFKNLCDDAMFLMNKAARHSLDEKNAIDKKFIDMDDETLEIWCDRAFQMFLGCMAVVPYLDLKKEIKTIKRTD